MHAGTTTTNSGPLKHGDFETSPKAFWILWIVFSPFFTKVLRQSQIFSAAWFLWDDSSVHGVAPTGLTQQFKGWNAHGGHVQRQETMSQTCKRNSKPDIIEPSL